MITGELKVGKKYFDNDFPIRGDSEILYISKHNVTYTQGIHEGLILISDFKRRYSEKLEKKTMKLYGYMNGIIYLEVSELPGGVEHITYREIEIKGEVK